MKISVLWVALALLLGLVLGGWGPRADLRNAREALKAEQAGKARSVKRSAELDGIRTLLKLPENKNDTSGRQQGRAEASTNTVANVDSMTSGVPVEASPAATHSRPRPAAAKEDIQKVSELWKTRVALARNSFISNAGLDQNQEVKFDVLVEAMNIRLGASIDKWATRIKEKGELLPEDGVRMVNELSQSLVITYDEFDKNLPENWRDKAGENSQLFNFIDPDVVTPFTEVEGLMNKSHPPMFSDDIDNRRKAHPSVELNAAVK